MAEFSDLTIILPTLNEVESIGQLLQVLVKSYPGVQIIVADDGSNDGTHEVVNDFSREKAAEFSAEVRLLDRSSAEEHGITASVLDALDKCRSKYFLVMDADFQHPPECVAETVERLRAGAQLVVNCRRSFEFGQMYHRLLLSQSITLVARLFLRLRGLNIADPLSGFFAGETEAMKQAVNENLKRFEPRGYKVLFDLLKVIPTSTKIDQVAYNFKLRELGMSKLRITHGALFFRSLFR